MNVSQTAVDGPQDRTAGPGTPPDGSTGDLVDASATTAPYPRPNERSQPLQATNTIRRHLQEIVAMWTPRDVDAPAVNVVTGKKTSCAGANGKGIQVNVAPVMHQYVPRPLSGPERLGFAENTANHELWHVFESVLTGKAAFMDMYPDTRQLAGMIQNANEDLYIDTMRVAHHVGLGDVENAEKALVRRSDVLYPAIDSHSTAKAAVEAYLQLVFFGKVRGLANAHPDIQAFCAWLAPRFDAFEDLDDPADREQANHNILKEMVDRFDADALERAAAARFDKDEKAGPKSRGYSAQGDRDYDPLHVEMTQEEYDELVDTLNDADDNDDPPDVIVHITDRDAADDAADDADDPAALDNDADLDARYTTLLKQIEDEKSDLAARKDARSYRRSTSWADRYRAAAEDSGLIRETKRAFRRMVSKPRRVRSRTGDPHMPSAIDLRAGLDVSKPCRKREKRVTGGRTIGVLLDGSASMVDYDTVSKAALAAIAQGANTVGDDFLATGFNTVEGTNAAGDRRTPRTELITAPDEDFEYEHLCVVNPHGYTPLPAGLADMKGLLEDAKGREQLLLVLCDGQPNVTLNGNTNFHGAENESQKIIRDLRRSGVTVVGVGFGGVDTDDMSGVFGRTGYVMADKNTLADKLLKVYRRHIGR